MEKDYYNMNYNVPPYGGYDSTNDFQFQNNDAPFFNPTLQYEQAYMYYRYLSKQMEYKIKCKEYEKLVSSPDSSRQNITK